LFLVGVCRESQQNLAAAAWSARGVSLRQLLLDAFDQRTVMLDDLERSLPAAGRRPSVQVGWRSHNGGEDPALLAGCLAGEETTLRTARAVWAECRDLQLRQVLQTHLLYLTGLLARFRNLNSR
jgi:hypothetical protein